MSKYKLDIDQVAEAERVMEAIGTDPDAIASELVWRRQNAQMLERIGAEKVALHRLVRRLRSYIACMAPHQRDRVAGQLLIEAANEIERLHAILQDQPSPPKGTGDA